MRYLMPFFVCLLTLTLHSAAWAEVYETTDAEGNPDFTDSPPDADAEVIDLQQPNIVPAPPAQPDPQQEYQPAPNNSAAEENNPAVVNDRSVNDGNQNDGDEDAIANEYGAGEGVEARALERSNAEEPHEVGDSNSQMPHEVGDSEVQNPDEVGDFPAPTREELRR